MTGNNVTQSTGKVLDTTIMDTVLILGCSGMLGHTLYSRLFRTGRYSVYATTRHKESVQRFFLPDEQQRIIGGVDAENFDAVVKVFGEVRPMCVVNCIGIIKQRPIAQEYIPTLVVNSLFPHRIAELCKATGARLIHISSDCVFDGLKGNYSENDQSTAADLYGRTKCLGEIDCSSCITLRTSIIGHELYTRYGLVEWFLGQTEQVSGYTRAIYSGLSSVELADIIIDYVIPAPGLRGLYHVSSNPISKFDLLRLIARQYGHAIKIEPDISFVVDRSLNSQRFRDITGYVPPSWELVVEKMHADFISSAYYLERQTT